MGSHIKMAQETDNLLDKLESEHSDPLNKGFAWKVWTYDPAESEPIKPERNQERSHLQAWVRAVKKNISNLVTEGKKKTSDQQE